VDAPSPGHGLHPARHIRPEPVTQNRAHAVRADLLQCFNQASKTREPLQLDLAEADIRDLAGAPDVRQAADWLIQHQRHRAVARHRRVVVPRLGQARLLEQLDPRRVQSGREGQRPFAVETAVRIQPQGNPAPARALDGTDPLKIGRRVLADLDLQRAVAGSDPLFHLGVDCGRLGRRHGRQQCLVHGMRRRQADMAAQHFQSGDDSGGSRRAAGRLGQHAPSRLSDG